MDYRPLGHSGCAVSALGLGTMTFGSPAETTALTAASDPQPTDYPYGELGMQQRDRRLAGGD